MILFSKNQKKKEAKGIKSAKKMKSNYLIYLILILIFSCKAEKKFHFNFSEYQLATNSCKSIEFIDHKRIFISKGCKEYSPDLSILTERLNGDLIELFCHDTLNFQIDSIDSNNGYYIMTYDRNNNKCHGLHIINNNTSWVVTFLKHGKRIDYDFTEPLIYKKNNTENDFNFDKNLTIQLLEKPKDSIFYIAFSQQGYPNSTIDNTGNTFIRLQSNINYYKTDLDIDPSFYAFKKYQIQLFNQSTNHFINIPVLYSREYTNYLEMDTIEKQQLHSDRKIKEQFVVVHRFNPPRERLVDHLYNEKIKEQVQDFEFVQTKEK